MGENRGVEGGLENHPIHTEGTGGSDDMPTPTSKRTTPSFQFYPSDFLSSAKVDMMSMTERGVYITLLCRCWLDNGLPTSMDELAEFARMKTDKFERLWKNGKIRLCFTERGGRLHQTRLDTERKKQNEYRKRQADAAKQRWESRGNATALPPHVDSNGYVSSLPVSSLPDSSQPKPIARPRRLDAAMEFESGLYVPQRMYDDFARMHPGEDLPSWFIAVASSWVGRQTGADMFKFWKARHDERWPPEQPQQSARPRPAWAPKTAVKP